MGYDLYITRSSHDDVGSEEAITLEEWQAYIDSDPDLTRPQVGTPNYHENLALLPRGPSDPEGFPWLSWVNGSISAKYPQPPTLKKMIQIANHFGAQVVGDEGEIYTLDENGKVCVSGFEN